MDSSAQPESQECPTAKLEVYAETGELLGAMVEALENAGLSSLQMAAGIQVEAQANN